jgi:hypothetical protein
MGDEADDDGQGKPNPRTRPVPGRNEE